MIITTIFVIAASYYNKKFSTAEEKTAIAYE